MSTPIQAGRDNVDASLAGLDEALVQYSASPSSATKFEVDKAKAKTKLDVDKLEAEVYKAKLEVLDNFDRDNFDRILAWTAKVNARVFQALDW